MSRNEETPMKSKILVALLRSVCAPAASVPEAAGDDLAAGLANPSDAAKPRVYWWWL